MQIHQWSRLAALPLLLLSLLTGCAHDSPLSRPTPPPAIPPLPAQARQVDLPTFSERAQTNIEAWRQRLTEPSSLALPASSPTER